MKRYDLQPVDGRKSFYGKAVIDHYDNGFRVLWSYNTPIMGMDEYGIMTRFWDGWSATDEFLALPLEEYSSLVYERAG